MNRCSKIALCVISLAMALPASAAAKHDDNGQVRTAETTLINKDGNAIGTASFIDTQNGVRVALRAADLPPGIHAIHVHEKGECKTPDFKSAGGHFNPDHKQHGLKNPKGHHVGDLRNLHVDSTGSVNTDFLIPGANLRRDDPHSLLKKGGTALVIHAKADDEKSNPAGNAGARIACGVIHGTNASAPRHASAKKTSAK